MIRIAQLHLERWGHFDGRLLAFGPAGRLHVVYGHNEAGKSTTRRAIGAVLFGVPERTTDTYGRPGSDLRIGARLELDGAAVDVVRRKGRKNTLLDAAGEPIDPAPLTHALGGLGADVYAGLFEITHESLVQGGHELLTGRGAVGEALFAAAAGTSRLQALLRRLEDEAEELFSTRPSKRPLNVRLARHAEALRTLKDAQLRPPEHEALARQLEMLEATYAKAGAALEETERERARLERLRGALPLAALRATRAKELEQLAGAPVLGADAPARRQAAQEQRERGQARVAAAERAIGRGRERRDELAVDEALLPFAAELEAQQATGAAVVQEAARREDLLARRTTLAVRLDDVVAGLAPALGERSVREVTLDAGAREQLEACLQDRAGVEQAVTAAQEGLAEAQRAADRAQRDAQATPPGAGDAALSGLAAALRAARGAGDVDEQVASARAAERTACRVAEQAAARLVPAPADAAALAELPVPPRATVETLLVDIVEAQRVADELAREADAVDERAGAAERQRDRIVGADAPVLDGAALADARAARDEAWAAVRAALAAPVEPAAAAELVAAHEATVAAADAVADTRLQRAEDVARLADLGRELVELAREAEELEHRRERHEAVVARAADAWSAAWAPAGDAAPAPSDAGAWLTGRDTVLSHLADADAAAERADTAEARRDEHRRALRAALAAAGADALPDPAAAPMGMAEQAAGTAASAAALGDRNAAPTGIGAHASPHPAAEDGGQSLPLATLIELAEARLETLRSDAERAARAADAAARTASDLDEARAGLERAERAQAGWQARWAELRAGCGLAETLAPADALGALRALEQAARDQEQLDALGAEIDAIDARRSAFEAAVAQLVSAVAPDLADQPAAAAVTVLHRRAADARSAAEARDAIDAELAELEAEHADALAAVATAEEELAALRAAAGAADDAELVRREQESARAEELRAEIADLDGKLARAGGAAADEVAAAVAALDADALPARAEELERLAVRQREDWEQAGTALTRARDELARLERSEEAARAAQEAASLEAEVRELAQRYARARLAQRVLRDAIARYRSAHEGPLLARANVLFPALTCERFARLETDVDERDQDVLVAVTADGSRRRVEELSDGTREQLFLALRLAAIERQVTAAEAVPVVFDDVLLESDDERAERVLAALADLARHTQVLVLTHHRHLVEIARTTLAPDRLDVLDLSDPAGAPAPDDEDDAANEAPTLADELEAALAGSAGPPSVEDQQRLL